MADSSSPLGSTANPTHRSGSSHTHRGHPRRGGHGGPQSHVHGGGEPGGAGFRDNQGYRGGDGRGGGGRGRNRGRGHGRGRDPSTGDTLSPPHSPTNGRPPGGSFGARLTEAATSTAGIEAGGVEMIVEENAITEDGEVCFICASPIEHTSIAPCNHQTCHICALRLRALYKTRACAHCRTESPFVIFTDDPNKRFEEFADNDFVRVDDNLGIKYEKDIIFEDTILLLRYNCPDNECDVACLGWPDLHRHVKTKHAKIMCDLCTRNKKVFTHEHELFTFGELRRHERFGDDNPGAIDQSGFKGHPECGFCRQRFYSDDELYNHCREKHERCHICDRRNGGRNPQYYLNYAELEKHFEAEHFVCLDAECQANKTNVFESEMDLKAHQLSEHPHGLTKDARRDARLVNLSGFDLRTPYQPPRGGGRNRDRDREREREREREGRGAGRGRDPNADPLPVSSAQPMSRAEMAFQRQMAIQSSQSVTSRNFGGQLTQSVPTPRSQPQSAQPLATQPPSSSQQQTTTPPSLDTLSLETSNQPTNQTPQEQARALRHQAVITRASTLLENNTTKISQFRTHVSSYRSNTSTATDLIDSFFSLFDCPSSELGKLIRELADLYEDDSRRQALLTAWNDWRSINEDYPSLPGPSGTAIPGSSASSTIATNASGRRVLKLKSSTAQSSRSAISRKGSWGNSLTQGNLKDPFPALVAAAAARNKSGTANTASPWTLAASSTPRTGASTLATRTAPSSTTYSSRSVGSSTSRSTGRTGLANNEELFPSLPVAQKPNTMMAGFNTKGSVKWNDRSANNASSVNPWGNGGTRPTPAQAAAAATTTNPTIPTAGLNHRVEDGDDVEIAIGGKKKGKKGKGKGETLFHFG